MFKTYLRNALIAALADNETIERVMRDVAQDILYSIKEDFYEVNEKLDLLTVRKSMPLIFPEK